MPLDDRYRDHSSRLEITVPVKFEPGFTVIIVAKTVFDVTQADASRLGTSKK